MKASREDRLPVKVGVYCSAGAELPSFATEGAAAMDVRACLPPDTMVRILPGSRMLIPTGLQLQIPKGFYISVRPRSGLALKKGLILPNAPGTIDSDYRGELKILVANIDREETIEIQHADRIAQIILGKSNSWIWEESSSGFSTSSTKRGGDGFGSTGLV